MAFVNEAPLWNDNFQSPNWKGLPFLGSNLFRPWNWPNWPTWVKKFHPGSRATFGPQGKSKHNLPNSGLCPFTLAPTMAQNWTFWLVLVSRVIMRSLIFLPAAGIKLICKKYMCSKIAVCIYRQAVKTKKFFCERDFLRLGGGWQPAPPIFFCRRPPWPNYADCNGTFSF